MNRVRARVAGTFAIVGAILSTVATTAAVAQPVPPPGDSGPPPTVSGSGYLVNRATGRCLVSNWAGTVRTQPCNSHHHNIYQVWDWINDGPTLMNNVTGQCLKATHRVLVPVSTTSIRTSWCSESDPGQEWDFGAEGSPPKGFGVLPNGATGDVVVGFLVLDSNKAGLVYDNTYNGGRYQEWHATGSLAEIVG